MQASTTARRRALILKAITSNSAPTLNDIQTLTQLPKATVLRQIQALRDDFGVDIQFVKRPGSAGFYWLNDSGCLDIPSYCKFHKV